MTFADIYDEVVLQLRDTGTDMTTYAKKWVNLAQQEVATQMFWPWLMKDEVVAIDAAITSGTAEVVNGDATVEFSEEVLPAAMEAGQWYFQSEEDTVWYPVESRTDIDTLELVEAYQGTSAATDTYKLWHVVYSMPADCWKIANFRNMDYIAIMNSTIYTRLDRYDPALQQSGTDSYLWSQLGADSNGYVQVEFWPPRITEGTQNVRYYKVLADLSADGDISQIPVTDHEILVFGALMRGFRFLDNFEQVEANAFEFLRRLNNMKKRYMVQVNGPLVKGGGHGERRDLLDMMQLPVTSS